MFVAALSVGSYHLAPEWYRRYVLPEPYGILEMSGFLIPMLGLFIAGRLACNPFVRDRPLMWTVALIAALGCLYIAGEETSWGQHFFHWNTPEYWAAINRQDETNLHNAYLISEGLPRSILEIGITIGGLGVPLAALFYPVLRACRISVFLPPPALVPTSLGAVGFKLVDHLQKAAISPASCTGRARPSRPISISSSSLISSCLPAASRSSKWRKAQGRTSRSRCPPLFDYALRHAAGCLIRRTAATARTTSDAIQTTGSIT